MQRIRADRIDILIDLNGYTSGSRGEIFVPGAAPIQIHWLGFLGTQGAEWFDYIITDRFATPPAMQPFFTERFLYLDCYTPSDTRRTIDPQTPGRAAHGLPEDAIVFCCSNDAYKILPPVFDAWMRILTAIPGSVLWLSPSADATSRRDRTSRSRRSIPAPTSSARGERPGTARLRLADLFLDIRTTPERPPTMRLVRLPLLTRIGSLRARRGGGCEDVPELVTADLAAYERRAIDLARAPGG
jgi:predicted O-linked N-acetylglucosamine transferase (SPINDLY family)